MSEHVAQLDGASAPRRRCEDCGEALVYMGLGVWACTEDRPEVSACVVENMAGRIA